jgi:hypothetical protein
VPDYINDTTHATHTTHDTCAAYLWVRMCRAVVGETSGRIGTTTSECAKAASDATTHSTLLSAQIARKSPYATPHRM